MNKVETINCAREYLLTHGWTQGTFQNEQGNVCLMGAFTRSGCVSLGEDVFDRILFDIRVLTGGPALCWNDQPGRTFNEVMDLFDELALKAKEENAK